MYIRRIESLNPYLQRPLRHLDYLTHLNHVLKIVETIRTQASIEQEKVKPSTSPQRDRSLDLEDGWKKIVSEIAENGVPNTFLNNFRDSHEYYLLGLKYSFNLTAIRREFEYDITREVEEETTSKLSIEDIAKAARKLVDRNYLVSVAYPKDYVGQ